MLKERDFSKENPEREPVSVTLRDSLVETTFTPNRAINPTIKALTLGELSEEITALRNMIYPNSMSEYGKKITVTQEKTFEVSRNVLFGEEKQIQFEYHPKFRQGHQYEFLVAVMHTHPFDVTFSPTDLCTLFMDPQHPTATTAAIALTSNRNFVMFRGNNTPKWKREDAIETTTRWLSTVYKRIKDNITPGMPFSQQIYINQRENAAFIQQAMQSYDLQLFMGNAIDQTMNIVSPNNLIQ